ncbi:MAG: hypothetical protein IJH67_04900 [Thermoguttaceae bacterium]|nr:hypothetical protein [Thermoguttaceae bacterium]
MFLILTFSPLLKFLGKGSLRGRTFFSKKIFPSYFIESGNEATNGSVFWQARGSADWLPATGLEKTSLKGSQLAGDRKFFQGGRRRGAAPSHFFRGFTHPGSPTLAAEASKNLENVSTTPTRWIAAVSAAKEISRKVRKVREVLKMDANRSSKTA